MSPTSGSKRLEDNRTQLASRASDIFGELPDYTGSVGLHASYVVLIVRLVYF
jgi:hypothetical protein